MDAGAATIASGILTFFRRGPPFLEMVFGSNGSRFFSDFFVMPAMIGGSSNGAVPIERGTPT